MRAQRSAAPTGCCCPTRSQEITFTSIASTAAPGPGRSSCGPGSSVSRRSAPREYQRAVAVPQRAFQDEAVAVGTAPEVHRLRLAEEALRDRDAVAREAQKSVVVGYSASQAVARLSGRPDHDDELAALDAQIRGCFLHGQLLVRLARSRRRPATVVARCCGLGSGGTPQYAQRGPRHLLLRRRRGRFRLRLGILAGHGDWRFLPTPGFFRGRTLPRGRLRPRFCFRSAF